MQEEPQYCIQNYELIWKHNSNISETIFLCSAKPPSRILGEGSILPNSLLRLAFLGAGPKLLQAKPFSAEQQCRIPSMQSRWWVAKDVALQLSQNLRADALSLMAATFQQFKEESLTDHKLVIFHTLLRWAEAEDLTLQVQSAAMHQSMNWRPGPCPAAGAAALWSHYQHPWYCVLPVICTHLCQSPS